MLASCGAIAPALLCSHLDMLMYLAPAAAMAFLIAILARLHPVFFLLTLAGTVCHELAHWLVGLATGARPVAFTVIPRKTSSNRHGVHWDLGSVKFARLRWYNAAPTALAPLLIVLIPFLVAWWRTRGDWQFGALDLAVSLALAPQFLSFWPSGADWRLAMRSWPYLLIIVAAGAAMSYWHAPLLHLVKS